jgi:hypothetical protein
MQKKYANQIYTSRFKLRNLRFTLTKLSLLAYNNHKILCLPPYYAELFPTELIRKTVKNRVTEKMSPSNRILLILLMKIFFHLKRIMDTYM